MKWWVYILYSVRINRTYTGITTNLPRRLTQHNAGKGAKATRAGQPWSIIYSEPAESKSAALKRELTIKKLRQKAKLDLAGVTKLQPTL